MASNDPSKGRPVFAARTVGAATPGEPHRTVHCGTLGRTVALEECTSCSSYLALDSEAVGGARVRCRDEAIAPAPCRGAEADDVIVTAIIRRKTTCIAPEADLATASAMLLELELGGLVVVDDAHRPIGMLTPADLARAVPEAVCVRDVMAPCDCSVSDQTSVARAAALMAAEGVDRLPVLGHDGRLVGVVTGLDVMRWIAERAHLLHTR